MEEKHIVIFHPQIWIQSHSDWPQWWQHDLVLCATEEVYHRSSLCGTRYKNACQCCTVNKLKGYVSEAYG